MKWNPLASRNQYQIGLSDFRNTYKFKLTEV